MTQGNRKWAPGQSGNPNGRPRGSGQVGALRKQIEDHVPEIITAMVAKATEGDAGAARLLLERVLPPIKALQQASPIALPDGSLTEQGKAVLSAIGMGDLVPSQGAQILQALGSLAKLVETDELAARIKKLEEQHAQRT